MGLEEGVSTELHGEGGGGLNLRSAALHAPAAFISSLDQSRLLIARIIGRPPAASPHLAVAVAYLARAADAPDWHSVEDIDVPLRQRPLSRKIDEATFNSLVNSDPDTRARALALSTATPHVGDWLNVVPSPALGLHLHDREFRLCLDYWFGIRIADGESRCPVCTREHAADPFGDHHVGCGGNGDRIHRHDALWDVLFSAAQSAALAPRKEVPSLIPGLSVCGRVLCPPRGRVPGRLERGGLPHHLQDRAPTRAETGLSSRRDNSPPLPETFYHPLEGEREPLAPTSPHPFTLGGWEHLLFTLV